MERMLSKLLKQLEAVELHTQGCRGEAFDNASVMAGHRSRVQKRFAGINPMVVFVPCTNHSLNLAGVHAALACV